MKDETCDETQHGTLFVSAMDICTKRLQEIDRLDQALRKSRQSSNKQLFQTIPKHLRRRAASHNPNRLPRNYRKQEKVNQQKHHKRRRNIKRIYRERTGLYSEIDNTKISTTCSDKVNDMDNFHKKWLETHMWHAKRMHMKDLWGWRIPVENSVKVKRHMYRISKGTGSKLLQSSTILHDKSYEEAILIQGKYEFIKDLLKSVSDPFDTTMNIPSSLHHGTFWFYKKYPTGFTSTVDFIFIKIDELCCTLTLWIPPFAIESIYEHLKFCCSLMTVTRSRMNKFELVGNGALKLIYKTFSPVNDNDKLILKTLSMVIKPSKMIPPLFSMCFPTNDSPIRDIDQELNQGIKETILQYKEITNNSIERVMYPGIMRLFSKCNVSKADILLLVMSLTPLTIHIILPAGCGSFYFDRLTRSELPVTPASLMDMIITKTSSIFPIYNSILPSTLGFWKSCPFIYEPSWIASPFMIQSVIDNTINLDIESIKSGIILGRVIMKGHGRPKTGSLIYSNLFEEADTKESLNREIDDCHFGIVLGYIGLNIKGHSKGSLRDGFSFEKGCGGNVAAIRLKALKMFSNIKEFSIDVLIGDNKRPATFIIDVPR